MFLIYNLFNFTILSPGGSSSSQNKSRVRWMGSRGALNCKFNSRFYYLMTTRTQCGIRGNCLCTMFTSEILYNINVLCVCTIPDWKESSSSTIWQTLKGAYKNHNITKYNKMGEWKNCNKCNKFNDKMLWIASFRTVLPYKFNLYERFWLQFYAAMLPNPPLYTKYIPPQFTFSLSQCHIQGKTHKAMLANCMHPRLK